MKIYLYILLCFSSSLAFVKGSAEELWDARTQLKPIAQNRESMPVQSVPYPQYEFAGFAKQEYLNWIQYYYSESRSLSNGTTLEERIAVTTNRRYDIDYAGYTSFWYCKLVIESGDEEEKNHWLNETIRWVRSSTDYFTDQDEGSVGFTELVTASLVYMRLRDSAVLDQLAEGSNEPIRDILTKWFLVLEEKNEYWEYGAMNRAIGRAVGVEALEQLLAHYTDGTFPTPDQSAPPNIIEGVDSRSAYVDRVWQDWSEHGDIDENSSHYNGIDMFLINQWIDLKDPGKWNDPQDPDVAKVRALAERYLEYMTPLGPIACFGDTVGWGSTPGSWVPVFEKWGAVFQDGRYRWVAENWHKYIAARSDNTPLWNNLETSYMNGLMEAYLVMDDSIAATMPITKSTTTQRKAILRNPELIVTDELIPDRAIFRTGWAADDSFAMLELTPGHFGHAHHDTGAIQSFVANGSVLLTSPPYRVDELEYQNAFIVKPATELSDDQVPASHRTGVHSYINSPRTGPFTYRISFSAQRLSGSPYLQIGRLNGGASKGAQCTITSDPIGSVNYVVEIKTDYASTDIVLTPVKDLHSLGKRQRVAKSRILLDDIKIEDISDPQNPIIVSFHNFNEPENGTQGWRGHSDGNATCEVAINGNALELRMLIDKSAIEITTSPTLDTFATSSTVGYAKLSMPDYANQPLHVNRHVFFLGKTGMWVKDQATFIDDFQGKIGPGWQLNQAHENYISQIPGRTKIGANWIVSASPATALAWISDPRYLMQWDNRAEDLMVFFNSPSTATMVLDSVLVTQSKHGNFQNNAETRAWEQLSGSFNANDTHSFNSVLIPHAPSENSAEIAGNIEFLQNTDALSVIRYTHVDDAVVEVFGINETGEITHIPEYDIETDARVFHFLTDESGKPIQYWLFDAQQLRIGDSVWESPGFPTNLEWRDQTSYDLWAAGIDWGTGDGSIGANASGTSWNNLAHYAFNLDPTQSHASALYPRLVQEDGNHYFVLRERTNDPTLSFEIEVSLDLTDWEGTRVDTSNLVREVIDPDPTGDRTIEQVRYHLPGGLDPNFFLKIITTTDQDGS